MDESHVMTMPTFYSSSGCSLYKSKKQFGFLPYFVGRTGGCAAANEPCPILTLDTLEEGFLAVTRVAMPTGQQQGPPGPKKGVMSRSCANLGIIKASTLQVQTHRHSRCYAKKSKRCHLLKSFLHSEL